MTNWFRTKIYLILLVSLGTCILLTACSSNPDSLQSTGLPVLVPYATRTPGPTPILIIPATRTPIPTPTPFLYKIAANDTLSALSQRFGVSLDAVLAANPGINPQSLALGQNITIPGPTQVVDISLLVTPVPMEIAPGFCQVDITGTTCIIPVHNPFSYPLENIQLDVTLFDESGKPLTNQECILPVNVLPSDKTLPASVFFEGQIGTYARALLLSSMRMDPSSERYLSTTVDSLLTVIDWNRLSASVQGQILLVDSQKPAKSVWLLAIAYDSLDHIVGYRRWENNDPLQPGTPQPFTLPVYSLGPPIQRVEIHTEARP